MRQGLLVLLFSAALAWGQAPRVTGGPLVAHAAAGGSLDSQLRSFGGEAYWVGYSVASTPGEHNMCCWDNNGSGCGLEGRRGGTTVTNSNGPGTVHLEGPRELYVLYRVEAQQVQKVRVFSPDCQLDMGGLTLHWLTGVAPQSSVQVLSSLMRQTDEKKTGGAIAALAFHADASAEAALEQMASANEASVKARRDAVFWLIQRGTKSGFATVQKAAREDRDDKVREHAIFSLSQSKDPQAIPTIIDIAKTDRSPHVRGQALFWLAQKAGKQAEAAITDAIDRDPDTEIKKKAVFALTQMPDSAGVPKLIEVARSNANPAVRKQAMFWLGQSKDPRALQFFEQVLNK